MKLESVLFLQDCEVAGVPYEKNEKTKISERNAQELQIQGKVKIIIDEKKERKKMEVNTNFGNSLDTVKYYIQNVQPVFFDKSKVWWAWDDNERFWYQLDEIDILNDLDDNLGIIGLNQSKIKSEFLNGFQMAGRRFAPSEIPSKWIQFSNTIVDLNVSSNEKVHTIDPDSKYFLCNPVPYKFINDPNIEAPFFDSLFEAWVGKEWKQTLYELLGYCMIPEYKIHLLFFLVGSGRNGKSTFLRILRKLIGMNNVTTSTLERLDPRISRFESALLYKKLACLIGETDFAVLKNTSLLKMLSGEDLISAEFKQKLPFQFVNYSKPIISTNSLPTPQDKTEGWDRRAFVIDFPNKFPEGHDILEGVSEEEYDRLATKCVFALIDLLKRGSFNNQGSIEERASRYEERSNPTVKFIKDNYIKDLEGETWLWEFKNGLDEYLEQRRYHKNIDKRELTKLLNSLGFETAEERFFGNDGKDKKWVKIYGLRKKEVIQTSLEKNLNMGPMGLLGPYSYKAILEGKKTEVGPKASEGPIKSYNLDYLMTFISSNIDIEVSELESRLLQNGWQIEAIDRIIDVAKERSMIFVPRSGIIRRV